MNDQTAPAAAARPRTTTAPPCALVIFGTSGDLTRRLLMPAVYNLAKAGRLSENFALIGVDRSKRTMQQFHDDLGEGIRKFVSDTSGDNESGGGEPFDEKAWDFLTKRTNLVDGDVTQPNTYTKIAADLDRAAKQHHTGGNAIFYLAVASSLFGPIVENLAAAGLMDEKDGY